MTFRQSKVMPLTVTDACRFNWGIARRTMRAKALRWKRNRTDAVLAPAFLQGARFYRDLSETYDRIARTNNLSAMAG